MVNNVYSSNFGGLVTVQVAIFYGVLAVVTLLYPIIGFLSDLCCSRFKVVIVSFSLTLLSMLLIYIFVFLYLTLAISYKYKLIANPLIIAVGPIAGLTLYVGFAGYQANFIQLGLNQHISSPSKELALFVHWVMWAYSFGSCIIAVVYRPYECFSVSNAAKTVIVCVPLLIIAFFVLVLVVSCCKHRWFSAELRQQNPFKTIIRVLLFARKHKYPIQRSAFTYSSNRRYSRLDFAKEIFGGPFTTEQVEDTKSFFKILAVLLALGPVFAVDVPSSYTGFTMFGYHVSNVHIVNQSGGFVDPCSSWILVWSGNLKFISGTLLFPIYMWFIFSYLRNNVPRMFVRLSAGVILYLLGNLCLLFIDLIGHVLYNKHSDSNAGGQERVCMFDYNSSHLELHWSAMILPSVLLGLGPLVVMTTTL